MNYLFLCVKECGWWSGLKSWEESLHKTINPKASPGPGDEMYSLYGFTFINIKIAYHFILRNCRYTYADEEFLWSDQGGLRETRQVRDWLVWCEENLGKNKARVLIESFPENCDFAGSPFMKYNIFFRSKEDLVAFKLAYI